MAQANIQAPTSTQSGDFSVPVTFDAAYNGVDTGIFALTPLWGNGITGIRFEVSGSGKDYSLMFYLPAIVEGSFEIDITGLVTPQGGSSPEAVMAGTATVTYDNTANVNATFGEVDYRESGMIAVPVAFTEDVIIPSETIFKVTRVSGDDLEGIDFYVTGEGRAFELVFTVPLDRKGRFQVSSEGDVLKVSSSVYDNLVTSPLTIAYDTTIPILIDKRVVRVRAANRMFPDAQTHKPSGDRIDCILQFNTRCTLNDPVTEFGSDDATFADFLDYSGVNLPPPNFYRKTDNDFPMEANLPLGEVLDAADWSQEGLTLDANEATIYLLRWSDIVPSVDFEVTIKPHFVRGPVR